MIEAQQRVGDVSQALELIYSTDCPNVGLARTRLTAALAQTGQEPEWVEWNRDDPQAPEYAASYGSPTVLVNGRDVFAGLPTDSDNCRIYPTEAGFERAPSVEALVEALSRVEAEE